MTIAQDVMYGPSSFHGKLTFPEEMAKLVFEQLSKEVHPFDRLRLIQLIAILSESLKEMDSK